MSVDMRQLLRDNLISTFKSYPTTVQDTLLEIIGGRLQEAYDGASNFTDNLLDISLQRPDIIQAKAAQHDFHIRDEASLSEQLSILNGIEEVYSKRGSIDTIENMYKYYGGNLPKDIVLEIPAHHLFRYSISKLSGKEPFQDGLYYRSGVYTINIEGEYDLREIRQFILDELVAAGIEVGFNKIMYMDISSTPEGSMYRDSLYEHTHIFMENLVNMNRTGLEWNKFSVGMRWSGKPNLFVDIRLLYELDPIFLGHMKAHDVEITPSTSDFVVLDTMFRTYELDVLHKDIEVSSTPPSNDSIVRIHLYDDEGNEKTPDSTYPGYFVFNKTLLGEVIINEFE